MKKRLAQILAQILANLEKWHIMCLHRWRLNQLCNVKVQNGRLAYKNTIHDLI